VHACAEMGSCGSKTTTASETGFRAPVLTEPSTEERALAHIKLIFESIGADKDRTVSKQELVAALEKDPGLGALIKEADLSQEYTDLQRVESSADGRVTWEDYQQVLKRGTMPEVGPTGQVVAVELPAEEELPADEKAFQLLRKLFECLDSNDDESVSQIELAAGLQKDDRINQLVTDAGLNPEYYVLEQLDTNKDGKITWDVFKAHLCQAAKVEVQKQVGVAAVLEQESVGEGDGVVAPRGLFCAACY